MLYNDGRPLQAPRELLGHIDQGDGQWSYVCVLSQTEVLPRAGRMSLKMISNIPFLQRQRPMPLRLDHQGCDNVHRLYLSTLSRCTTRRQLLPAKGMIGLAYP